MAINTDYQIILVYVTFPDLSTAKRAAIELLEKKLVACANILPSGQSFYLWEGAIEEASENILLLKTQALHFQDLCRCIESNHPYKVPAIIRFEVTDGHGPYLQWIGESTRKDSQGTAWS